MSQQNEFNLEKLEIRKDLTALMTEVKLTNGLVMENIKVLNEIVKGNGDPTKGHTYRIAKLEDKEESRKGHMKWMWGTLGLAVSSFFADIAQRFFLNHK